MKGWQSTFTVGLLIILAGSTAYYASRSSYLAKQVQLQSARVASSSSTPTETSSISSPSTMPTTSASTTTTPTATPSSSTSPSSTPTSTTTAQVVTVASADRLSQPAETYKVAQGDTLYAISLKQNMSLEKLAQANNLKDPFPLKLDQLLLIPTVNGSQNIFEVDFTADTNRVSSIQQETDGGKNAWRLNPATVALAENAGAFGLNSGDQYQVKTSDTSKGTAMVSVSHAVDGQTKNYSVELSQPGKKGSSGIWTIVRISPTS